MCTSFEPALYKFCVAAAESGKPIELIMVSSDRSSSDVRARAGALADICSLHVPFEGSTRADLKRMFKVWAGSESFEFGMMRRSGVPTLVVLNPQGEEMAFLDTERRGISALAMWPIDEGVWGEA